MTVGRAGMTGRSEMGAISPPSFRRRPESRTPVGLDLCYGRGLDSLESGNDGKRAGMGVISLPSFRRRPESRTLVGLGLCYGRGRIPSKAGMTGRGREWRGGREWVPSPYRHSGAGRNLEPRLAAACAMGSVDSRFRGNDGKRAGMGSISLPSFRRRPESRTPVYAGQSWRRRAFLPHPTLSRWERASASAWRPYKANVSIQPFLPPTKSPSSAEGGLGGFTPHPATTKRPYPLAVIPLLTVVPAKV